MALPSKTSDPVFFIETESGLIDFRRLHCNGFRPWPMAPKRFTFFQIVGDQALAIDFGQFEGADSEFKCYQSCNPAVFAYFAIFCVFKLKLQG